MGQQGHSAARDEDNADGWADTHIIDFGEVDRTPGLLSAEWRIRNPRRSTRHIIGVDKSCACQNVVIGAPGSPPGPQSSSLQGEIRLSDGVLRIPMKAGEERTIRVELDPMRLGKRIHGSIKVLTDDPIEPVVAGRLRGRVRDLLVVQPATHEIGEILPGRSRNRWMVSTVHRADRRPMRIVDIKECPDGLFADFHVASADRSSWKLRMRVMGIDVGGPFYGHVRFVTEGSGIGGVRVVGHVRERVRFSPAAALILGVFAPGEEERAEVLIRSDAGHAIGAVRATWERMEGCVSVETSTEEVRPTLVRVVVRVTADGQEGNVRGRLTVRLPSHDRTREIEVYGYVRSGR